MSEKAFEGDTLKNLYDMTKMRKDTVRLCE